MSAIARPKLGLSWKGLQVHDVVRIWPKLVSGAAVTSIENPATTATAAKVADKNPPVLSDRIDPREFTLADITRGLKRPKLDAVVWIGGGLVVLITATFSAGAFFGGTPISPTNNPSVTIKFDVPELAKQLVASQQTQPLPGEENRIGAAVTSIAKGAAGGDMRLQQALDLLKAHKTGDATQLLQGFASDKDARIQSDRKEAGIAYRNLGAIVGLGDPKRALDAYEKAVELDPDDVESLYWIGYLHG